MSPIAAGSRLHFRDHFDATTLLSWRARQPGDSLPWRPLDRAVWHWVRAHGGSDLLAELAAWASLVDAHGDSALALTGEPSRHGMILPSREQLEQLADQGLLAIGPGDRTAGAAFVLEHGCFYLRRNYRHECRVAEQLRLRRQPIRPGLPGLDQRLLLDLFAGSVRVEEQQQFAAVRQVLDRRLFVLTGGPGTGKTTTVLRMLLALARQYRNDDTGEAPRIRLCAPTGKAAQRLGDALRVGSERLAAHGEHALPAHWSSALASVAAAEIATLHRLLGSRGANGGFLHHPDNRLPADIVVVDEASMVDLTLLRALLDALADDCLLVLVGDADQLTSIGTGSVLADLVAAMEADGGADLVRLRHCFRADTALLPINEAIRSGEPAAFAAALSQAQPQVSRHPLQRAQQLPALLQHWSQRLSSALAAVGALEPSARTSAESAAAALAVLRQQQLLCALREGEFGAQQANAFIEDWFRQRHDDAAEWFPGRAVMITRNDPFSGLYNGDIGLCLADGDGGVQVWFEALAGGSGAGQPRAFAAANLPPHEGAFAITIHKSQGSEYDEVAILLPADANNPLLSRQLLYTAASRARKTIALWSSDAALAASLAHRVTRMGRLTERLRAVEPAAAQAE